MMIFSTSLNDNMSIQKSSLKKKTDWDYKHSLFFFLGILRSFGYSPSLLCLNMGATCKQALDKSFFNYKDWFLKNIHLVTL